jgi:hypothetical protein
MSIPMLKCVLVLALFFTLANLLKPLDFPPIWQETLFDISPILTGLQNETIFDQQSSQRRVTERIAQNDQNTSYSPTAGKLPFEEGTNNSVASSGHSPNRTDDEKLLFEPHDQTILQVVNQQSSSLFQNSTLAGDLLLSQVSFRRESKTDGSLESKKQKARADARRQKLLDAEALLDRVYYTKPQLEALIESFVTTFSVWKRSKPHSWCHQEAAKNDGLLYVKLPKCASSTASGVAMRVADKLGQRLHGKKCVGRYLHSPASHDFREYGKRNESTSFLWSVLREPNERIVSHYFFEQVSRQKKEASEDALLSFLNESRAMKKSYMLRYLKLKPFGGKSPSLLGEIMKKYDFIGVSDRMDESLVVLAMIMQVPVADMAMLSSKIAGSYDAGRGQSGCVKLVPKQYYPAVDTYLQSKEWRKDNWDYVLFQVVNRTLDRTIDYFGRANVAREVESLRLLTQKVQDECISEAIFPCPETLPNHRAASEESCYFADSGCGYKCIDRVLHETSDRQWDNIVQQLGTTVHVPTTQKAEANWSMWPNTTEHSNQSFVAQTIISPSLVPTQDHDQAVRSHTYSAPGGNDTGWVNQDQTAQSNQNITIIPDWLQRYIRFHRESIEGGHVKDGVPFLVYHCHGGCAGLGGRIKAMIKSFYTAVCSKRVFLIDSPFPFPLEDYLAPNMIEWNATYPNGTIESDIFVRAGADKNNITIPDVTGVKIAKAHGKTVLDVHQMWLTSTCRTYAKTNMIRIRNIDEHQQYHWASRVLFRFTDQVTIRAEELRQSAGIVSSAPYVGIHLRTGSGSTWWENARRLRRQELASRAPFAECFRMFRDRYGYSQGYAASDNDNPKNELHQIEAAIKIAKVEAFHIDKSLSMNVTELMTDFRDRNGLNKFGVASIELAKYGTLDLFAELKVLVDAKCIIMSESSLSFAAHVMSLQPNCGLLVRDCSNATVAHPNLKYNLKVAKWRNYQLEK